MADVDPIRVLEEELLRVAHDWSNLLAIIAGRAHLIATAPSSDEIHEDAREILAACERAATLVKGMSQLVSSPTSRCAS